MPREECQRRVRGHSCAGRLEAKSGDEAEEDQAGPADAAPVRQVRSKGWAEERENSHSDFRAKIVYGT